MSFAEILVVSLVLAILVGIVLLAMRAVNPQQAALDRFNRFHLAAGTLIETLKQDVRSARKLEVSPGRLAVVRTTGIGSDGELESQTVEFHATASSVLEEREGKTKVHGLLADHRERVQVEFEVASVGEDLGARTGNLWILIRGVDQAGREIPRLVATASVQVKVAELSYVP